MQMVPRRLALALAASLVLGACGAAPSNSAPLTPTTAPVGSLQPGASTAPTPPGGSPAAPGAALVVRGVGSGAACRTFVLLADCAAFLRLQPTGKPGAPDLPFAGDPTGPDALVPGPDWPTTIAPGTYRITAHLDRLGRDPVLPPATPDRRVDRTCRADVTVPNAATKVSIRVTFDLDAACKVAVSFEPKPSPTRTPKPTKKP